MSAWRVYRTGELYAYIWPWMDAQTRLGLELQGYTVTKFKGRMPSDD